jgi:hypothetical protein
MNVSIAQTDHDQASDCRGNCRGGFSRPHPHPHYKLIISTIIISFILAAPIPPARTASESIPAPKPQVINDASGQTFMEETTPVKPSAKPSRIRQLDLGNVGVQVDPSGKIVPLINNQGGPVKPLYSHLEVYDEPAWNFIPPLPVNPYGRALNIYGQPIDAFGNAINQYGQPLNTWARLGIPFLGTTPPPVAPIPYAPYYGGTYPYWNNGTNLNLNLGRNIGLNLGSVGTPLVPNLNPTFDPQAGRTIPFLYAPPWRQFQSTTTIQPILLNP